MDSLLAALKQTIDNNEHVQSTKHASSKLRAYIGGLQLIVHGLSEIKERIRNDRTKMHSAVVLFFLHSLHADHHQVDVHCQRMAAINHLIRSTDPAIEQPPHLIVVSFDHVNHGTRSISQNRDWQQGNVLWAVNLWEIMYGSALDVSRLIDTIPAHFFPEDEAVIKGWGVSGISLGGHTTFLAMAMDDRLTVGIPMIACADFTLHLTTRASELKPMAIPVAPPYFPTSFLEMLKCRNAAHHVAKFKSKALLIIGGREDTVVPPERNNKFVEALEKIKVTEEEKAMLKVTVVPGVRHEVVEGMMEEAVEFVKKWLVRA